MVPGSGGMWSTAWPGGGMFTGTGGDPTDTTGLGEREELRQEMIQIMW